MPPPGSVVLPGLCLRLGASPSTPPPPQPPGGSSCLPARLPAPALALVCLQMGTCGLRWGRVAAWCATMRRQVNPPAWQPGLCWLGGRQRCTPDRAAAAPSWHGLLAHALSTGTAPPLLPGRQGAAAGGAAGEASHRMHLWRRAAGALVCDDARGVRWVGAGLLRGLLEWRAGWLHVGERPAMQLAAQHQLATAGCGPVPLARAVASSALWLPQGRPPLRTTAVCSA